MLVHYGWNNAAFPTIFTARTWTSVLLLLVSQYSPCFVAESGRSKPNAYVYVF